MKLIAQLEELDIGNVQNADMQNIKAIQFIWEVISNEAPHNAVHYILMNDSLKKNLQMT
jgi:hypothetical protein